MAGNLTPDQQRQVQAAASSGNLIPAIKLYREFTGAGLAEAKHAVEQMAAGAPPAEGEPPVLHSSTPDPEVVAAIYAGYKIQAIKAYRDKHPAFGLAEAKEYVEKLADELYAKEPHKFKQAPTRSSGCTSVLVALVAIATLAWYFVR